MPYPYIGADWKVYWGKERLPKPPPPVGISQKTVDVFKRMGWELPPGTRLPSPIKTPEQMQTDVVAAKAEADKAVAQATRGTTIPLPPGFLQTWTDGSGDVWSWDPSQGEYTKTGFDPTKVYQTPEKPATTYPREEGQPETWTDNSGVIWSYDADTNNYVKIGYDPTKDVVTNQQQAAAKAEQESNQQYFQWQQQQATAQLEAQKQERLATLRANPASWLEYASLAGTTPSVQPWMLPLMPQQYQGTQAGAPLPGYQQGGATMSGLPALTTPSRQFQARMTPSARQQYGGYEQARTGMTPEDLQWRLWSQAPPSGQFGGLNWKR